MPYVAPEIKEELVDGRIPENVGELTFCVTSQLAMYLDEKLSRTGGIHYQDLAECKAALVGALRDFNERVEAPYEKKKAEENGDVWGRGVIEYVGGDFYGYL
jgi:hypothetical protein